MTDLTGFVTETTAVVTVLTGEQAQRTGVGQDTFLEARVRCRRLARRDGHVLR